MLHEKNNPVNRDEFNQGQYIHQLNIMTNIV